MRKTVRRFYSFKFIYTIFMLLANSLAFWVTCITIKKVLKSKTRVNERNEVNLISIQLIQRHNIVCIKLYRTIHSYFVHTKNPDTFRNTVILFIATFIFQFGLANFPTTMIHLYVTIFITDSEFEFSVRCWKISKINKALLLALFRIFFLRCFFN